MRFSIRARNLPMTLYSLKFTRGQSDTLFITLSHEATKSRTNLSFECLLCVKLGDGSEFDCKPRPGG